MAVVAAVGAALAIFAFPSLLSSGKAGDASPARAIVERANEAAAIGSLRAIASAENAFASTNGSYGTMDDLLVRRLDQARWTGTPVLNGYRFDLEVDQPIAGRFA